MQKPKLDAVYLDFNASSPILPDLVEEAFSYLRDFPGNPSSLHGYGRQSKALIRKSTELFSQYLGCNPNEVFWTSGATESNAWALQSAILGSQPARLLVSAAEHESVVAGARFLETQGHTVETIRLIRSGIIDLGHLEILLADGTADLVSLVHANNETGAVQPVEEVLALCDRYGVPLHVDAVQTLGKFKTQWETFRPAYLTFSGHKIGALKGTGALVINSQALHRMGERDLSPIIFGKQQHQMRGGTENVLGIACFGAVIEKFIKGFEIISPELAQCQRDFETKLKQKISGTIIYSEAVKRLPNTTYFGFEELERDGLVVALDLAGYAVSSGSACTSGMLEPSETLLAMGFSRELAKGSVRISSGFSTRKADFENLLDVLPPLVERMRGKLWQRNQINRIELNAPNA